LREIRIGLLSLLAPITPFLCEGTWQTLREQKEVKELSLFLGAFPRIEKNYIDDKGEQIFQHVQKVVELGLRARDKAHIGLKWPLGLATITSAAPLPLAVRPLIMKQLQVKKLAFVKGTEYDVTLDTTLTPALEGEGYARELARAIQGARKEAGLQKGELIITQVHVSPALEELLAPYQSFLLERTNSKKIVFLDEKKPLPEGIVLTVRERRIVFSFRRC
jgi:isoleucyl-tRNA synthetase